MKSLSLPQLFTSLFVLVFVLIAGDVLSAWDGPSDTPPLANVPAPVNVGTTDQVKDAGLSLNALAVFGNSLLAGDGSAATYLNFGATSGSAGYGFRSSGGLMEFRDSGGTWNRFQTAGGGTFTETDPQVGTLTSGGWCTSNGTVITCSSTAPTSYTHKTSSCVWYTLGEGVSHSCPSNYFMAGAGFDDGDDWISLKCCKVIH